MQSTGTRGEASASRYRKINATVEAADAASRILEIKDLDTYKILTVSVPQAVQGFDTIGVGDKIQIEVAEGLLLEVQPAESETVAKTTVAIPGRSSDNPIRSPSTGLKGTVTITSIDSTTRVVQFQDGDGNQYQVRAGPTLSLEKVKVGDRLLATYVEAVAITLYR